MDKIIKILKKIKLKDLIIIIILLAFNTYAWFIYSTKVSGELTAHVSAWEVEFTAKDMGIESDIVIEVERIYPGMETYEKEIEVINKGELNIYIDYEIKSLKIMDEYYEVSEESEITSQDIENKMQTEYPFKILIEKDGTALEDGTGNGKFTISVEWPFESGDDELDTKWGNKAYEYYSLHPGENCITLNVELKALQKQT